MSYNSETLHYIGQIFTPWFAHVTKWVLENAEHPVRLLLRDSVIIDIVAKELAKTNPDFSQSAHWETHYFTRAMGKPLTLYAFFGEPIEKIQNDENAQKVLVFLNKHNWDKQSYTVVDTGYKGTIPGILNAFNYKVQPLFMFSQDNNPKSLYCDVYGDYAIEQCSRSLCYDLFEFVPKTVESPTLANIQDDGELLLTPTSAEEQAAHEAFASGLRKGVESINRLNFANIPNAKESIELISDNFKNIQQGLSIHSGRIREKPRDEKEWTAHFKKLAENIGKL